MRYEPTSTMWKACDVLHKAEHVSFFICRPYCSWSSEVLFIISCCEIWSNTTHSLSVLSPNSNVHQCWHWQLTGYCCCVQKMLLSPYGCRETFSSVTFQKFREKLKHTVIIGCFSLSIFHLCFECSFKNPVSLEKCLAKQVKSQSRGLTVNVFIHWFMYKYLCMHAFVLVFDVFKYGDNYKTDGFLLNSVWDSFHARSLY